MGSNNKVKMIKIIIKQMKEIAQIENQKERILMIRWLFRIFLRKLIKKVKRYMKQKMLIILDLNMWVNLKVKILKFVD